MKIYIIRPKPGPVAKNANTIPKWSRIIGIINFGRERMERDEKEDNLKVRGIPKGEHFEDHCEIYKWLW